MGKFSTRFHITSATVSMLSMAVICCSPRLGIIDTGQQGLGDLESEGGYDGRDTRMIWVYASALRQVIKGRQVLFLIMFRYDVRLASEIVMICLHILEATR